MIYLTIIPLIALYILLCRHLRFRRIRALEKRYAPTKEALDTLDYKQAQYVLGQMAFLECPWTFLAGKDFAFLRAFAIPGISKVSVGAKEMIDRTGKRYSDTTVLVGEWLVNDIDSERACLALNRVNWIHSRYGSAIRMDQMVYTLCLLICEGLEWIDKFDWRQTTALEKHASYVFWKEVGKRMGLSDIPANYEACASFVTEFETANMAPSKHNEQIANAVIRLYASTMPSILAPVVEAVVIAMMDDTLAGAFRLKKSGITKYILNSLLFVLEIRKFFLRNLSLPRYKIQPIMGSGQATSRINMIFWEIEPWYVAKTFWNQYGLYALYARLFGLPTPADKYEPEGYHIIELGPLKFKGKGHKEIMEVVQRRDKNGACAFSTFGWNERKPRSPHRIPRTGSCPMMKLGQ